MYRHVHANLTLCVIKGSHRDTNLMYTYIPDTNKCVLGTGMHIISANTLIQSNYAEKSGSSLYVVELNTFTCDNNWLQSIVLMHTCDAKVLATYIVT